MTRGIFLIGVSLAAANVPAPAPAPTPQQASASQQDWRCTELCRHRQESVGIGRSMQQCMTQCAIRMDVTPPQDKQDAARRFVEDHALNEKGGQNMKNAYHRVYGEKIESCKPVVDLEVSPNFSDIDANGDGRITAHEAIAYGNKMCVPDEMTIQIFMAADNAPHDGRVTPAEFSASGEDTLAEKVIDRAADGPTEGDNEYSEASLVSFDTWDQDKDGFLQKDEAFQAFMHELKRRNVAHHGTVTSGSGVQKVQDETWHGIFDTVFPEMDVNGDGKISHKEFYGPALGSDFGEELRESALADEDAADPDDGHQSLAPPQPVVEAPVHAVPTSMLRSSRRSTADGERYSTDKDRESLQELKGAMKALVHHEDAVALSKTVLVRVVDEAIRLRKEAAQHKHQNKFAHLKAI